AKASHLSPGHSTPKAHPAKGSCYRCAPPKRRDEKCRSRPIDAAAPGGRQRASAKVTSFSLQATAGGLIFQPQAAQQAVLLTVEPRGEVECPRRPRAMTRAEFQRPQAVNRQGATRLRFQRAQEGPRVRIKGVDPPVPEVAHQQGVAEAAIVRRRDG